jgi:hypothetical protein
LTTWLVKPKREVQIKIKIKIKIKTKLCRAYSHAHYAFKPYRDLPGGFMFVEKYFLDDFLTKVCRRCTYN